RGQANLFTPLAGGAIHVELAVASPRVDEIFPVRRPPMQVRGSVCGHPPRNTALYGDGIDHGRLSFRTRAADAEHRAVEGDDVVVVVADDLPGVDDSGYPRREIEPVDPTVHIVDQGRSVRCPVGRLQRL